MDSEIFDWVIVCLVWVIDCEVDIRGLASDCEISSLLMLIIQGVPG